MEEISDHEELCPAFSNAEKDCVCDIIYQIIVEEDYKKTECIQISFDEGIEFQKEIIYKNISDYLDQVSEKFSKSIESEQHHGSMLLYSGIIDALEVCKKIVEES